LIAWQSYLLFNAIRIAPSGKLDPMKFEEFIPTWWTEEEIKDTGETVKERLKDKISTAMAAFGGVDTSVSNDDPHTAG
jgi:hypothetical protein